MHRVDTVGAVSNRFTDGTPPIDGTICDDTWLNAVQEELCSVIEAAGLTVDASPPDSEDQLVDALKIWFRENPVILAATGASGTFAVTADPVIASYTAGDRFIFEANHTPAVGDTITLNVNAQGAKSVKTRGGNTIMYQQIVSGQIVSVIYDGADFVADLGETASRELLNGAIHAWYRWLPAGSDQMWRCTAAFDGSGQYTITFDDPPASWWDASTQVLMFYNIDSNTGEWACKPISRGTTNFTIEWAEAGTPKAPTTNWEVFFIGNVTPI